MPFSPWVPTISLRTHSSPFHCHQRTKVTAVPTKKSPLFIFSQRIKVCRGDDKSCYSENSRRMPDRWSVNKNIKKKSVLNDCLLVYMWNVILWEQLTEPNRDSPPQRNPHLAGGRAWFPWRHRSWLKFHTALLPNAYTQWTCVRGILLNVNHWYIMSTREKHKVKQEKSVFHKF